MERFRKRIRGQHGPRSDHGRRGWFQGGFRVRAKVFARGPQAIATGRPSGSGASEGGGGSEDECHRQQQQQQQR